jgi:hypothetical protein
MTREYVKEKDAYTAVRILRIGAVTGVVIIIVSSAIGIASWIWRRLRRS